MNDIAGNAVRPERQDSGSAITRRTVVKGFAWSVPVVAAAVAAPAYANSAPNQCPDGGAVDFAAYQGGIPATALRFSGTGVTAALRYAQSHDDLRIADGGRDSTGNVTQDGLWLKLGGRDSNPDYGSALGLMNFIREGEWVSVTIAFSQPVTGLRMVIGDIDSGRRDTGERDHWDQVSFSVPPVVESLGSRLQGAGTSGSPIEPNAWYEDSRPDFLPEEQAVVSWPACLNSITLTYRSGSDSDHGSNQYIAIKELSFEGCTATCS